MAASNSGSLIIGNKQFMAACDGGSLITGIKEPLAACDGDDVITDIKQLMPHKISIEQKATKFAQISIFVRKKRNLLLKTKCSKIWSLLWNPN